MELPKVHKALILAQSIGQANQLQEVLRNKPYPDIEFRYPSNITHQSQDLVSVYKDSCATIEEEDIDIIINVDPGLNFVQSALAKKYEHLLTPSMESLVLCCHTYYNKLKISHDFCDNYWLIDFEDDVQQQVEKVYLDTNDSHLLFTGGFRSVEPPKKVRSANSFMKEIDNFDRWVQGEERIQTFLRGKINDVDFPLTFHKCALLHVDSTLHQKNVSYHTVEICVSNGNIVPWIITDQHFWKCNKSIPKSVSVPTKLSENLQFEVWATLRVVVQRLINNGFDNHFLYAKIIVQEKSRVKIIDMESSIVKHNPLMYRHVYSNGDSLGALIDIGLDRLLDHPKLLPCRAAIRAQLIVFRADQEPVSISEVADVAYAKQHPNVILYATDHSTIVHDKRRGFYLADVIGLGADIEECENQIEDICMKIVKDRRCSHWTHCLHK